MQGICRTVLFFVLLVSSLLPFSKCKAQTFEGEIIFTKETRTDTSFYSYKIKGTKIRIEELDQQLKMINYMLVDVSKPSVHAINPKRKLYVEMPTRMRLNKEDTTQFTIYKTENYKTINGYKCFQWRVRNNKERTEIAYWVCGEFIDYFADFLKLINREEKSSIYYLHIPNSTGFLPLNAVERSLLREWKSSLEVLKIERKNLATALFEIPQGYRMFQKN